MLIYCARAEGPSKVKLGDPVISFWRGSYGNLTAIQKMSDIGTLCPIATWLSDEVIDPDLRGPIAKARLEFKGKSEDDVEALWEQLQIILHGSDTFITYRADYCLEDNGHDLVRAYVGSGRGKLKPDNFAIFRGLLSQKDQHLRRFNASLDENSLVGGLKMIALLILYEAMDGNPEGALKASGLFDHVYMGLRDMIDVGLRIRKGRQLAAKKTAAGKAADIKARDQKILAAAMQLLAGHRYGRRDIASLLATRFDIKVRTIRRILKTARV